LGPGIRTKRITDVSWYESHPGKSLELIRATETQLTAPLIDVGGGASFLVDELINAGYLDLTVLDISAEVLQKLRARLGAPGAAVAFFAAGCDGVSARSALRALARPGGLSLLVQREDRERYVDVLRRALLPNGHVVIATFGPSGPERCSGLATMRYDANALATELGDDFRLVDSSLTVHRTPSGVEQTFLYCRFDRQACAR